MGGGEGWGSGGENERERMRKSACVCIHEGKRLTVRECEKIEKISARERGREVDRQSECTLTFTAYTYTHRYTTDAYKYVCGRVYTTRIYS